MSNFVEDLFLVDIDTQYVSFHVSKQKMTSDDAFAYIKGIQCSYPRSMWAPVDSKMLQFWKDLNFNVSNVWEDVDLIAQRCMMNDDSDHYWITTNVNRMNGFLEHDRAHVVLVKRKQV